MVTHDSRASARGGREPSRSGDQGGADPESSGSSDETDSGDSSEGEDETYVVEKVLDYMCWDRKDPNKPLPPQEDRYEVRYLVKWLGYDEPGQETWEPKANFSHEGVWAEFVKACDEKRPTHASHATFVEKAARKNQKDREKRDRKAKKRLEEKATKSQEPTKFVEPKKRGSRAGSTTSTSTSTSKSKKPRSAASSVASTSRVPEPPKLSSVELRRLRGQWIDQEVFNDMATSSNSRPLMSLRVTPPPVPGRVESEDSSSSDTPRERKKGRSRKGKEKEVDEGERGDGIRQAGASSASLQPQGFAIDSEEDDSEDVPLAQHGAPKPPPATTQVTAPRQSMGFAADDDEDDGDDEVADPPANGSPEQHGSTVASSKGFAHSSDDEEVAASRLEDPNRMEVDSAGADDSAARVAVRNGFASDSDSDEVVESNMVSVAPQSTAQQRSGTKGFAESDDDDDDDDEAEDEHPELIHAVKMEAVEAATHPTLPSDEATYEANLMRDTGQPMESEQNLHEATQEAGARVTGDRDVGNDDGDLQAAPPAKRPESSRKEGEGEKQQKEGERQSKDAQQPGKQTAISSKTTKEKVKQKDKDEDKKKEKAKEKEQAKETDKVKVRAKETQKAKEQAKGKTKAKPSSAADTVKNPTKPTSTAKVTKRASTESGRQSPPPAKKKKRRISDSDESQEDQPALGVVPANGSTQQKAIKRQDALKNLKIGRISKEDSNVRGPSVPQRSPSVASNSATDHHSNSHGSGNNKKHEEDPFNFGKQRQTSKNGYVVVNASVLQFKKLPEAICGKENPHWPVGMLDHERIRWWWKIGDNPLSNFGNFDRILSHREVYVTPPPSQGEIGTSKQAGAHEKDYQALQLVLAHVDGVKQADSLRPDVTAVFVHASLASELGRFPGKLSELDRLRERDDVVCFFYGTGDDKQRVLRRFWKPLTAITFTPSALIEDTQSVRQLVESSALNHNEFDGARDQFAFMLPQYLLPGGAFGVAVDEDEQVVARSREERARLQPAVETIFALIRNNSLSLTAVAPSSEENRGDQTRFPAFDDRTPADPVVWSKLARCYGPRFCNVSLERLQKLVCTWRSQYWSVRRWSIIATREEIRSLGAAPGITLTAVEEAQVLLNEPMASIFG